MKSELASSQKKRFQFLLMKALDNESTKSEQREFERFLAVHDECKQEWRQLEKLQEVIQDIKLRMPPKIWDKFLADVFLRLKTGLMGILFYMASIGH